MTYRFKLSVPLVESVRRVGLEQLEIVEAKLASKDDIASAVHAARRSLKRLRALLRLIRPGLDEAVYEREAGHLTGTARLLSQARDLEVMRQTLSRLERAPHGLPRDTAARLHALLADGDASARRNGASGRREALRRLKRSKVLFAGKALADIELAHLVEGLGRTYRKARKAFRAAYAEPSDEAFHTWRKHVQLHWRQILLLSRGWPEAMAARASEAKEISRLLGEDHDHAVLVAFAQARGLKALDAEAMAGIAALCRGNQARLRDAALPRGERLFADPARTLERRLTRYWTSAQALAALAPPAQPSSPARRAQAAARRPAARVKAAARQGD